MIRVNKIKFKQAIDAKYKNHEKYDAMYLFIGFLEDNKIWNEFFSEIHKQYYYNMGDLLVFFFRITPVESWISNAFIFSNTKRGFMCPNNWNEISDKWKKLLKSTQEQNTNINV